MSSDAVAAALGSPEAEKKRVMSPPCSRKCGDCIECLSPLPYGASCASSCAHVVRCQTLFGQKGSEAYCQFIPSQWTPPDHVDVIVNNDPAYPK
jgi:hypothetical protein